MSDRVVAVVAAGLGFGTMGAHDALEKAKKAGHPDEKIGHLTEAIELLLGHVDHLDEEKRREQMNREMGNI
jgi:hypothetical protein